MTREPALELIDATVVKGGAPILDGLTLTIRVGEHTALVGPNGAGKSTLVQLLTHHERALARSEDDPSVRVFGSPRWDVFELRSQLGIVSASAHQQFVAGNSAGSLTGAAVVLSAFFATHGFIRPDRITPAMRERTAHALERMEVGHLASRMMNEMSTGEARRVLIARALVTLPRALVLDEPTEGLDLVARHRFLDAINRVAIEGTTLIVVTHHVEEIVPAVERVVLLKRGRVAFDGPKPQMLTAERLSEVFGARVEVSEFGGRYFARA